MQEIQNIKVSDLVLWTENPRDPINSDAKDQDIVDMALSDRSGLWKLSMLASQMGDFYDFSEIPIVVYQDGKPVVYDGNRRVILAKISKGLVTSNMTFKSIPLVPDEIPCNVCDKDTAISSVLRKHGTSGSWRPLERDRFILKYKGGKKSDFLIIEEATGVISSHEKMNQGFVKDEVFSPSNLNKIGLRIKDDKLESQHTQGELAQLLDDLCEKVEHNYLSTRQSRGNVVAILTDENKAVIQKNKDNVFTSVLSSSNYLKSSDPKPTRRTRRTKEAIPQLFGKDLVLKQGDVNNLYRDICDLYIFYQSNKSHLSSSFTALIRMSLRLLCETASNSNIEDYLRNNFAKAKKSLSQDEKTLLSSQNVTEGSIVQLLHTGAHNYISSQNFDQTLAISIILGAILQITHHK